MQVGTIIFVVSYALIALGEGSPRKLDRPTAALLGAVLMLAAGVLSQREAAAAIDLQTLALLFGLMALLTALMQSHLPEAAAFSLLRRCRTPEALLGVVVLGAGLASAFLLNDTVCLLGAPLLVTVITQAGLPPKPYLLALATSANIGSVMTLTGNPQNVLIGHASGWGWTPFALRMIPIGLLCLGANWAILRGLYRHTLLSGPGHVWQPLQVPPIAIERHLAKWSVVAFLAFLVAVILGAPMALAALAATVGLLVWVNRPPRLILERVDWSLLLFFAGLFVIVAGVVKTDAHLLEAWLGRLGTHLTLLGVTKLSLATVLGSNAVSNVPFVLILRPWVGHTADPPLTWLVLALTSTFAGNLTLLGSVANVIVAQRARPSVDLRFWDFLSVGLPVTAATVLLGVLSLLGYRALGWVR